MKKLMALFQGKILSSNQNNRTRKVEKRECEGRCSCCLIVSTAASRIRDRSGPRYCLDNTSAAYTRTRTRRSKEVTGGSFAHLRCRVHCNHHHPHYYYILSLHHRRTSLMVPCSMISPLTASHVNSLALLPLYEIHFFALSRLTQQCSRLCKPSWVCLLLVLFF